MKKLIFLISVLNLCNFNALLSQTLVESADGITVEIRSTEKIITIGGSITETVYALGFGDNVIATDQSSTFPPRVFSLPRVPYVRNLSSEGILSLGSTLIFSSDEANPKSAIEQIRDAGTPVLLVEDKESLQGVIDKIEKIAKALGAENRAENIIQDNKAYYNRADSLVQHLNEKPKVLFILAVRGTSSFMVAGDNTGAQKMIELAGGINAFKSFEGYKNVSNESIMAENPDYILVMETRSSEITNGLNTTPGINSINAVENNKIISMDGNYLLGFGPRFGNAILDLIQFLHPQIEI